MNLRERNQRRCGSVAILDSLSDNLHLRQYNVSEANVAADVKSCIKDIEQDPSES